MLLHLLSSVDQQTLRGYAIAKLPTKSITEEIMFKNRVKEEVIRGVTEEVRGVSSVTYDLTLVCKGGGTVRFVLPKS